MKNYIIENNQLQKKPLRYMWMVVTVAMWLFFVYLWLPLISLFAWWLGFKTFYYQMVTLNGFSGFLDLFSIYAGIIVLLSTLLVAWALLENSRFKNRVRRISLNHVTLEDTAQHFKVNINRLNQARDAKKITVEFKASGEIERLI